MTELSAPNRCRIVLIAPDNGDTDALASQLAQAAEGGDIASVILPAYGLGESAFQKRAEKIVPMLQERGIAVMIAGDMRIAARSRADGVHLDAGAAEIADAVERARGKMMVGAGGAKTRHEALELGEAQPDYLFFGRIGYDLKPEPHPRNLGLAEWWAEMVEIPCIVMAGSDLGSIRPAAATRADFVALSAAVFGSASSPREAVAEANAVLDADAPRFEDRP